jgi:hypothetical protein
MKKDTIINGINTVENFAYDAVDALVDAYECGIEMTALGLKLVYITLPATAMKLTVNVGCGIIDGVKKTFENTEETDKVDEQVCC